MLKGNLKIYNKANSAKLLEFGNFQKNKEKVKVLRVSNKF